MTRTTNGDPNIAERVKSLLAHTGGTMPATLIVYSDADAAEANRLLAASKDKSAKLIDVQFERR